MKEMNIGGPPALSTKALNPWQVRASQSAGAIWAFAKKYTVSSLKPRDASIGNHET
jgi:hypothetical protein